MNINVLIPKESELPIKPERIIRMWVSIDTTFIVKGFDIHTQLNHHIRIEFTMPDSTRNYCGQYLMNKDKEYKILICQRNNEIYVGEIIQLTNLPHSQE